MPEEPTYQVGSWSGVEQFTCLHCGYDAFSLAQLATHMTIVHGAAMVEAAVTRQQPLSLVPSDEQEAPNPEGAH